MFNELDYEVTDKLDNFANAIDRKASAEIDAGCCGTSRDWDKAHDAQEKAENMREEFDVLVLRKIKDAYEFGRKVGEKAAKKKVVEALGV